MKKIILIGANSKANNEQLFAANQIGQTLAQENYLTIHGGGDGVMKECTKGMKKNDKPKGDELTYIIWPDNMIPSAEDTLKVYENVKVKVKVKDVNERISILCEEAKNSNYIIMFGGGIGTIHEFMSLIVHFYDHPDDLPTVLYCSDGDDGFMARLLLMLTALKTSTRPYMDTLLKKISILSYLEINQQLKK